MSLSTSQPVSPQSGGRLLGHGPGRARPALSPAAIARRRFLITWTKRLLPLAALALLSSIALWPELQRESEAEQVVLRQLGHVDGTGRVFDPHYTSVDEKGRPYTVTATEAVQAGPERVNLTRPKGDVTLQNGAWLYVQAKTGVYMRHAGQLDLQGDATLYRDDGTTMHSPTATVDLKSGAASSANVVSAEGPFGTLDAMGFTLLDKGSVVQFSGPARLMLNGRP